MTFGTLWSASYNQGVHDAVKALIYGESNTSIPASTIIDEVIAARGSMSSLDGRLDVSINEDGTLKNDAEIPSRSMVSSLVAARNLVTNGDFTHWANGAASAPDGWSLAGVGATIARTGLGESDTTSVHAGRFSCKLTRAGNDCNFNQDVINATDFPDFAELARTGGKTVTALCIVQASAANQARIALYDGIATEVSSFHSGGGTPEMLNASIVLDDSASALNIRAQVIGTDGGAYFGGMTMIVGDIRPTVWGPFTAWDNRPQTTSRLYAANVAVGNVGAGEDTLVTYKLAPKMLKADGQVIRITGYMDFANNANNKHVKVYFGGTSLSLFNAVITNVKGKFVAEVVRSGSANQRMGGIGVASGVAATVLDTAIAESMVAEITIKVTAEATLDNDAVLRFFMIEIL